MTTMDTRAPHRLTMPTAALIGTLAIAGCSSGHVGESWQCPLAEGGTCGSVAAADPAVPNPKAAATTALAEPLWRVRPTEPAPETPPETVRSCERECGAFDPFGWLVRLFGDGKKETGPAEPASEATKAAAPADGAGSRPAEPSTALPPAESGPAQDDPGSDDLRTGEVVARIWIAPFVDADGVYREASHVRVVLEPAGWRLP